MLVISVIEKDIKGSVVMICSRCKSQNLVPLIENLLIIEEYARCYHCGLNMLTGEQVWEDNRGSLEKLKGIPFGDPSMDNQV